MIGKQQTKHSLHHSANSVDTDNEVNRFYARFDVRDFSEDCASLCETIVPEQLDLFQADVVTSFSRLNLHIASSPDGLKGRTQLGNDAAQLGKNVHSNLSTILGLACYASRFEDFHNNICAL